MRASMAPKQSGGNSLVRYCLLVAGKGAMAKISIDANLMNPDDAKIVEDLIVAAHKDAKKKAKAAMAEKVQALTGGLPLPPGLSSSSSSAHAETHLRGRFIKPPNENPVKIR